MVMPCGYSYPIQFYFTKLQFSIFCNKEQSIDSNTDELLHNTRFILDEFPIALPHKKWENKRIRNDSKYWKNG